MDKFGVKDWKDIERDERAKVEAIVNGWNDKKDIIDVLMMRVVAPLLDEIKSWHETVNKTLLKNDLNKNADDGEKE